MSIVFLDGDFIHKDEAKISPDDRGFLLADGVYEVTPFYSGVPFGLDRHMARLERGLAWMRIHYSLDGLEDIHNRLIRANDLQDAPTSYVYLQITRGAAPRTHYFPQDDVEPTVYAFARTWQRPSPERWARGFSAVTVPDRRWSPSSAYDQGSYRRIPGHPSTCRKIKYAILSIHITMEI